MTQDTRLQGHERGQNPEDFSQDLSINIGDGIGERCGRSDLSAFDPAGLGDETELVAGNILATHYGRKKLAAIDAIGRRAQGPRSGNDVVAARAADNESQIVAAARKFRDHTSYSRNNSNKEHLITWLQAGGIKLGREAIAGHLRKNGIK